MELRSRSLSASQPAREHFKAAGKEGYYRLNCEFAFVGGRSTISPYHHDDNAQAAQCQQSWRHNNPRTTFFVSELRSINGKHRATTTSYFLIRSAIDTLTLCAFAQSQDRKTVFLLSSFSAAAALCWETKKKHFLT